MSWIRNNPFGSGYGKVQNYRPNSGEYDPTACFDSFRKHWQQISDIIEVVKVVICVLQLQFQVIWIIINDLVLNNTNS